MIPLQQALDGLYSFAVNDVLASMPTGVNKFVALVSVSALRNDPSKLVKPYEAVLMSLGILSDDGAHVDEKLLRSCLTDAFSEMPKVSWMGFTFCAEDAARLVARIGG